MHVTNRLEEHALTVVLQHSRSLELNRIFYGGRISNAQMVALADYQLAHPDWLAYDVFNLIAPGADFSPIRTEDLDAIVAKYTTIFAPRDLLIFRRSAWINRSPAAQAQLDHWIARRNTRKEQTLDARQFESVPEAANWLVLTADKAPLLETGEGFEELARYDQL
ncbi:MAG: hypothetical protein QM759_00375 [Terricaulis sp.]